MRNTAEQAAEQDPSRQILAVAVGLLSLGVLLLAISLALDASPALQPVGRGLRIAVPYVLLADFAPQTDRGRLEDPTLPAHRGQQPPATTWCARVFEDIEWRRFEAVCESLFAQAGFETRPESHGADGGADIWLYAAGKEAAAAVVHCRHWLGKPVGVQQLRDFFGVMASHKLHRGTFATSSTFTAEAQQFAKESGITAPDGPRLLALIAGRTPAQEHALLAIAYEGEYWRPTCANCGQFPRCQFTLPARAAKAP